MNNEPTLTRRGLLGLGAAALFTRSASAQPRADLDGFIARKMQRARAPGLSAAVVRDGRVTWARGYGFADLARRAPVTTDTLFITASVSKPATAMALMQLVDQRRIGLDDNVSRHMPFAVAHPRFPRAAITARMLLTHTAGITDSGVEDGLVVPGDSPIALRAFMQGYFTPGGRYFDLDANFSHHAPGTHYEYSNLGMTLAGYLVESVSGEGFSSRCRRSLFAPLGMRASGWYLSEVDVSRCAVPYSWESGTGFVAEAQYGFPDVPDGALRTTASEYAQLLLAMLRGGAPVLSRASVDEMCREQVPSIEPGQGLCWYEADDTPAGVLGHNGAYTGASADVLFDRARNVGVVVLSNGPTYLDGSSGDQAALTAISRRLLRDAP